MNNSVADLAIRIKNGYMAEKPEIVVSYSVLNTKIIEILKSENYIADFSIKTDGAKKTIEVTLKYTNNNPAVTDVQVVSKPGRRMYSKAKYIKPILGGLGIAIMTTPKGVMTDREARTLKVGGEVLFKIW